MRSSEQKPETTLNDTAASARAAARNGKKAVTTESAPAKTQESSGKKKRLIEVGAGVLSILLVVGGLARVALGGDSGPEATPPVATAPANPGEQSSPKPEASTTDPDASPEIIHEGEIAIPEVDPSLDTGFASLEDALDYLEQTGGGTKFDYAAQIKPILNGDYSFFKEHGLDRQTLAVNIATDIEFVTEYTDLMQSISADDNDAFYQATLVDVNGRWQQTLATVEVYKTLVPVLNSISTSYLPDIIEADCIPKQGELADYYSFGSAWASQLYNCDMSAYPVIAEQQATMQGTASDAEYIRDNLSFPKIAEYFTVIAELQGKAQELVDKAH